MVKLGQGDYANAVARLAALSPFAHPGAANAGKENAAQQAQANAGHNTQAGNTAATAAGGDEKTNISRDVNGENNSDSEDGGSATGPKRCKLETYADRKDESKKCAEGEEAHHLVPDRTFRYGVRRDHIDKNGKIKERLQIPGGLSDRDGLTICLTKKKHDRVHKEYDKKEKEICLKHDPATGMVDLFVLEQLASEVVAKHTGCSPSHLKQQLREHHGNKKMGKKFKVRANKNGNLTRKYYYEKILPKVKEPF